MSTYKYEEVVQELVENGVISGNDVFDISLYPNRYIFDRFFEFCQKNLSEKCVEFGYNIEPSKFYFTNSRSVNACASHGQKYYVIRVNMGAMHNVFDLFCKNDILEDPELSEYKAFDELLKKDQDIPLAHLMFQIATQFTFYHELGHLIQFSNRGAGKTMLAEQYTETEKFDPLKHILELDADSHGANSIAFHVQEFWDRLSESIKSEANLEKLTVTSLVGVLGYIFFLWQSLNEDIYYDKYAHPHPLIRISWIATLFLETMKTKFNAIQSSEIVNEIVRVLDIYHRHKGMPSLRDRFQKPMMQEYENIMGYCHSIIEHSQNVPFLAMNTIHKK